MSPAVGGEPNADFWAAPREAKADIVAVVNAVAPKPVPIEARTGKHVAAGAVVAALQPVCTRPSSTVNRFSS